MSTRPVQRGKKSRKLFLTLIAICLAANAFRGADTTLTEVGPKARPAYQALCWLWTISEEAKKELDTKTYLTLLPAVDFPGAGIESKILEAFNTSSDSVSLTIGGNSWHLSNLGRSPKARLFSLLQKKVLGIKKLETEASKIRDQWKERYEKALKLLNSTKYGSAEMGGEANYRVQNFYAGSSGNGRSREEACLAKPSAPATKAYAGISLANDLLCICLPGTASYQDAKKNLCGVKSPASVNWNTDGFASPDVNLEKYTGECAGIKRPVNLTEANVERALANFESLLGANLNVGASSHANKFVSIFGYAEIDTTTGAANACKANDGDDNNQKGQCVNYGGTSDGTRQEIDWLQAAREGARDLHQADRLKKEYRRLETKSENLLFQLEDILDDANASSATKPELPRQLASDKAKGSASTNADPSVALEAQSGDARRFNWRVVEVILLNFLL